MFMLMSFDYFESVISKELFIYENRGTSRGFVFERIKSLLKNFFLISEINLIFHRILVILLE